MKRIYPKITITWLKKKIKQVFWLILVVKEHIKLLFCSIFICKHMTEKLMYLCPLCENIGRKTQNKVEVFTTNCTATYEKLKTFLTLAWNVKSLKVRLCRCSVYSVYGCEVWA